MLGTILAPHSFILRHKGLIYVAAGVRREQRPAFVNLDEDPWPLPHVECIMLAPFTRGNLGHGRKVPHFSIPFCLSQ